MGGGGGGPSGINARAQTPNPFLTPGQMLLPDKIIVLLTAPLHHNRNVQFSNSPPSRNERRKPLQDRAHALAVDGALAVTGSLPEPNLGAAGCGAGLFLATRTAHAKAVGASAA